MQLDRMGDKSAANLVAAINASKTISLARFILALGIRFVGESAATLIADAYENLEQLQASFIRSEQMVLEQQREYLLAIDGIGPETADSVVRFFSQAENRREAIKLLDAGIDVTPAQKEKPVGALAGKTVVLTGRLTQMTRGQAAEQVKQKGGRIGKTVSSKTDFLVTGEKPGSKLTAAQKAGVRILDEAAFLKILGEKPSPS